MYYLLTAVRVPEEGGGLYKYNMLGFIFAVKQGV